MVSKTMDLADIFAPCTLNEVDLSGWDTSNVSPETVRLIREVLIDKALNGTQCQKDYAKDILEKTNESHL